MLLSHPIVTQNTGQLSSDVYRLNKHLQIFYNIDINHKLINLSLYRELCQPIKKRHKRYFPMFWFSVAGLPIVFLLLLTVDLSGEMLKCLFGHLNDSHRVIQTQVLSLRLQALGVALQSGTRVGIECLSNVCPQYCVFISNRVF